MGSAGGPGSEDGGLAAVVGIARTPSLGLRRCLGIVRGGELGCLAAVARQVRRVEKRREARRRSSHSLSLTLARGWSWRVGGGDVRVVGSDVLADSSQSPRRPVACSARRLRKESRGYCMIMLSSWRSEIGRTMMSMEI